MDYQGGDCLLDNEAGILNLDSPTITIPAGAEYPALSFDQWMSTEPRYDGGNLKIKVNGGSWVLLPSSSFTFNAYNATLLTSGAGINNPMAGSPAFTGTDGGTITGSWGTSRVDLTGIAGPGDTVQLRFDMGVDGCNGLIGWYVDNVQLYFCSASAAPAISVVPTSLSNLQVTNQVVTKTLVIQNGGVATLDWNLGEASTLPKTTGLTPAGEPAVAAVRSPGSPSASPPSPAKTGTEVVQDGSFETGTPNSFWNESSTNFGTPICDGNCSSMVSANTGSWFAWFGGIAVPEEGQLSQTVNLGSGGAFDLSFYLWQQACDSAADYLEVLVDSIQVYQINGTGNLCGSPGYVRQTVNLDAYADGQPHTLTFHSSIFAFNSGITNFIIDDVSITTPQACDRPQELSWLSVNASAGNVTGLNSSSLIVSFNSTGLAAGSYQGNLCFSSNDPVNPTLAVPAAMNVVLSENYFLYLPLGLKP